MKELYKKQKIKSLISFSFFLAGGVCLFCKSDFLFAAGFYLFVCSSVLLIIYSKKAYYIYKITNKKNLLLQWEYPKRKVYIFKEGVYIDDTILIWDGYVNVLKEVKFESLDRQVNLLFIYLFQGKEHRLSILIPENEIQKTERVYENLFNLREKSHETQKICNT